MHVCTQNNIMISIVSQYMHVVYAIKVFYAVVENRTELCKCSWGQAAGYQPRPQAGG